ncbi:hypothetical protein [Parvularcula maris]|uniref:Uncharacterized protein n=1 Tax=Parvularcula maris TaxID=2965077 RepID=A0A9X2RIP5_9PROT|nr:hypothetical protein [Parvularcula maris]MCQ8186300.1 hypothetical protein [Parvularcula maris]
MKYPETPDGRYFVAKERLWRKSNPELPEDERQRLVRELMNARRAVKDASTEAEEKVARAKVHEAKVALGERGTVWWEDGAPDENRKHPKNTSYADWWAGLQREKG